MGQKNKNQSSSPAFAAHHCPRSRIAFIPPPFLRSCVRARASPSTVVMMLQPLRRSALSASLHQHLTATQAARPFLQCTPSLRLSSTQTSPTARSDFLPPPKEDSGPLMSRLPNRSLPTLESKRTWLKTLPIFVVIVTLSSLAIFNYQKSSSSTVNSILYALRTNETAREILGDEIYFASKTPWIRGEMNQLHGRININFWVKGRKGSGRVKFHSARTRRAGYVSWLAERHHKYVTDNGIV